MERARQRRPDQALPCRRRPGRSLFRDGRDRRATPGRGHRLRRDRSLLPDKRPKPRPGDSTGRSWDRLHRDRRDPFLRPARGPRHAGVPSRPRQPRRRGVTAPHSQHAAARHRRHDVGASDRFRQRARDRICRRARTRRGGRRVRKGVGRDRELPQLARGAPVRRSPERPAGPADRDHARRGPVTATGSRPRSPSGVVMASKRRAASRTWSSS